MTTLDPHMMHPSRTENSVLRDEYGVSENHTCVATHDQQTEELELAKGHA